MKSDEFEEEKKESLQSLMDEIMASDEEDCESCKI